MVETKNTPGLRGKTHPIQTKVVGASASSRPTRKTRSDLAWMTQGESGTTREGAPQRFAMRGKFSRGQEQ